MVHSPGKDRTELSDLSKEEYDNLFRYQAGLSSPKKLNEHSFYIAHVTRDLRHSRKTLESLYQSGILCEDSCDIHTERITKEFSSQHSRLPVLMQKKLVNMLFTWEEELMRFRMLEEEKTEIETVMDEERRHGGGNVGHLEKRLKEIEGLMGLRPSQRGEAVRAADELPGYSAEVVPSPALTGRQRPRRGYPSVGF
ncbi:hypothetical protein LTS18_004172 [Coniosporium uncinatum]|uniref:Uncharacterized protein n=1 Tax=Coniosporium uncinatum TaxID=93489 RepID=A0ACC3DSQ9_9PEZI|nr:hypothetical protein LTS18_004172 [Coniosporium uncinatum]